MVNNSLGTSPIKDVNRNLIRFKACDEAESSYRNQMPLVDSNSSIRFESRFGLPGIARI
jgi:hypothetical protein